jgi:hypothetical protein
MRENGYLSYQARGKIIHARSYTVLRDNRSNALCFRLIDSELQLDFKPRFCVRLDPVRRVAVS